MEYYDRAGNIITAEVWQKLFSDDKYRRVKYTTMPDGTVISTVWLGLTHGMGPNGPQIFETMLKKKDEDWEEQYRYATQEEAIVHHRELVGVEEHANTYGAETRWNQIGDDIE